MMKLAFLKKISLALSCLLLGSVLTHASLNLQKSEPDNECLLTSVPVEIFSMIMKYWLSADSESDEHPTLMKDIKQLLKLKPVSKSMNFIISSEFSRSLNNILFEAACANPFFLRGAASFDKIEDSRTDGNVSESLKANLKTGIENNCLFFLPFATRSDNTGISLIGSIGVSRGLCPDFESCFPPENHVDPYTHVVTKTYGPQGGLTNLLVFSFKITR